VTISDRKKDVIITGGENVSSIEVEDALFSHPDGRRGRGHRRARREVGRDGARPGGGRTGLHHHRGRAHRPHPQPSWRTTSARRVEFRDELARTATGKLQKFKLREPYWEGEGEDVALALDRASGRQLWETVLPGIRATGGPIAPTVLIDGPRVYLVRESQDEAGLDIRVDAVALADGAALWRFEPGEAGDVRLLAPGRLMVASRGGGGMILAGATGESTQQMAKTRVLCAVPEGLLASDLGAATLVPAVADGPPWRAELEPPWRIGYGPCGVRDEDPVLGTRSGADEHVGLVRVDRRTGLPRWRLDLETTQADPILTLDGRLPRFLPVAVYGSHGEQELRNELVIVDLDAGVVVNRKTIVQHVEVLATPARAWLWVQFKNTLAGLDPATGELASATAFAEFSGNDIRHDDLQFGVLWLHSMRWDRPARLPWAAVDLATGEVLHAGPQVVTRDESAAIQSMLGG
jgi:hypothetical protein